ncbi:MAG: ABC transporter permease [Methanomassiliicoccales archaeon]|nr:MAG: ABC transporter permease [Methanomassiliicoccales archaeon]
MLRQTYALTIRELKHWYRARIQIFMTLIQPILWLGLFGQAVAFPMPREMLQGAPDYISFMSVGMVAVVTLFTCMFSGMSIVWDRRLGFLNKLRVAPIPRGVIPTSRVLASVIRAMISGLMVLLIALVFVHIPGLKGLTVTSDFGAFELGSMLLIMFLLALGFAAIFVSIALTIKNQETLFGVVNLLNLPVMFASAALFPVDGMPGWLEAVAKVNPLTLAVDGIRQLMFEGATSIYDLGVDMLGLMLFAGMFVGLGIILARYSLKEK